MKHISILIPHGPSSTVNIDGSHQILTMVNSILAQFGKEPAFNVQLVGHAHRATVPTGAVTITPDASIDDITHTDLVIIPAMYGELEQAMTLNKDFIPWIKKQHDKGAEIASMCIGAFLLASTGLLDGKRCSTHWRMADEFRQMYPAVNLIDEKMVTEDSGIYTSGGAYSYLNLLMYIIEKHAGRDMAIMIAKSFAIDIDRDSQSPFMIFQGQKGHNDEEIKRAQQYIEQNFSEKISVDELADMHAVGRRSFERRFKKATNNTIIEYAQRVKVEAAKRSFETSRKNINEVMYEVGYTDSKGFRDVFKKLTGLTPIEYRNKYSK
ncbi:AraC family transcriptional regulator [Flavipsychrobacter stenotrophus]|uniref:AraC family transcriptional regulator n=1 Tax=Flavipsychrobacter stenotrophus TaxID=2077091 RepID=A0A2S7SVV7_9BACT|nr:helix-turn-helix domain-containing protein [Flavipsychrobacter stenotrophus]PQJ11043.1 AraC family transcriptional regulator [Flavipsychrobacter stenotrophus]